MTLSGKDESLPSGDVNGGLMSESLALLLTDVVDSTRLNDELGDEVMASLWRNHDATSRELIRAWHGCEVGRSDGFLILFDSAREAVGFAEDYHRTLSKLAVPLTARIGVHVGPVSLRRNSVDDTDRGATPFEVDGVAVPVAARVMSAARGGQTLLTGSARDALGPTTLRVQTHGHWHLKGLPEPLELFEVGDARSLFAPPADSPKAYRVVRAHDGWTAARELPNTLPAERDAFIGRSDELRALGRLLDADSRLVTLLGIGGIGKTRLALRYARTWIGNYPGGAWFCDLSAARSVDGIAYAVAQGLGVPLGKSDPIEQLGAAIAGRGACIVLLDNFEQVARYAEQTVGGWLERAPEVRFIVTSREVLGVAGEQALVLAPLSAAEAVQMFEQRMRAVGVHEAWEADDEAAILPLVDLLDRLPLAIELAAARVRLMPPRMLLERMGERFKMLAVRGGRSDRQATMRATLDWSWGLLSPHEQAALAQISVFEGGFTLEAAEAVVELSASEAWLGDVVQALVEKSLVRRSRGARIALLQTVQEYAADRLAQPNVARVGVTDAAAVARRHWKFFARFENESVMACLAELENLVTACRRSSMAGDGPSAAACLIGAWQALKMVGPFRAALGLIELAGPICLAGTLERIKLHWVTGRACHLLGEQAGARRSIDDGLAAVGVDVLWRARFLCASGEQFTTVGQVDAASEQLQLALAAAKDLGGAAVRRDVLNAMGALAMSQSNMVEARRCYEEALGLCVEGGDADVQGALLGNLGEVCMSLGHAPQAHDYLERALALVASVGHRRWEGNIRCNLGLLHHDQGRSAEARQQLETALQIARDIGYTRLEATVLCNLGIVCAAAGLPGALDWHEQAVALACALGDPRAEGQFRTYLGQNLIDVDLFAEASECLTRGETLLRQTRDLIGLALLLCERVRLDAASGLRTRAMQTLDEAKRIGERASVDMSSELGRALHRAETLLVVASDATATANESQDL